MTLVDKSATTYPRYGIRMTCVDSTSRLWNFDLIPKSIRYTRTGYTEPDTAEITLDTRDFPFDPRDVVNVFVSVHADTVATPELSFLEQLGPQNARYVGVADSSKTSWDESGGEATLTFRDLSSLLKDASVDPSLAPPIITPIQEAIRSLISMVPSAVSLASPDRIAVFSTLDPAIGSKPLSSLFSKLVSQVGATYPIQSGMSVWDIIQDIATRAGLVAMYNLDVLMITDPMSFQMTPDAPPFDFAGNFANLERLEFGKDYYFTTKGVEVRSYDALTGLPSVGEYPLKATKAQSNTKAIYTSKGLPCAGVAVDPGNYETYVIAGLTIDQCVKKAKSIYETKYAQEMNGSLVTREESVTSLSGIPKSIFDMAYGQPILINLTAAEQNEIKNMDQLQGWIYMTTILGYTPTVASALQALAALPKVPSFFVTSATQSLSHDNGFSCEIDFVNYIGV